MSFVTIVNVKEKESQRPLGGVKVALFDRDNIPPDDNLGVQFTNENGVARFVYTERDFIDLYSRNDENPLSGYPLKPDIYVVVYGANGEVVMNTRTTVVENTIQPAISIALDREKALWHGLIKRKPVTSQRDKERAWDDYWKKRRLQEPGPGPDTDLCIGRVVLDLMAGAADPKNDLQKKLATTLRKDKGMSKKDLATIAEHAKKGLDLIDQTARRSGLVNMCSSDADPSELAKLFFSPGGPLHGITQAQNSVAPDPETTLPSEPMAGKPFSRDVEWVKGCQDRFNGIGGPIDDDTRTKMEQYKRELIPPSVNLVQVWSPALGNNVREASTIERSMLVRTLSGKDGWDQKTISMDVPLDSPECLVMQAATDGKQVLVVDVKPGQKVDLRGSGFINKSATVEAFYRPWNDQPNEGRLEPKNILGSPADDPGRSVQSWHNTEVEVYGSDVPHDSRSPQAYVEDRILFEWPEAASAEGLYRVRFKFENDPNVTQTPTKVTQNASNCHVDIDYSPVQTQELWFAVIRPVTFRPVRIQTTALTCLNETNPERIGPIDYFDDVVFSAAGAIQRVDASSAIGEDIVEDAKKIEGKTLSSSGPKEAEHWFWSAPEVWPIPDAALFPKSGIEGLPTLGRFDFVTLTLVASEIEGATDRQILTLLTIAFIVALVAILIAIVIAAVVVVVVFGVAGWLSFGVAWAILGIIELVLSLFGAFIVALLHGALGAMLAIWAAIPPGDLIANASVLFTGSEIAHRCSPIRFHRALWMHNRPSAVSNLDITHETNQFDENGIRESYTCFNRRQDSRYRMEVVVTFS